MSIRRLTAAVSAVFSLCFCFFIHPASGAVFLNQEALDAVFACDALVCQLQRYVEFLRFSLMYISPAPETGLSFIKGSKSQDRFARIFGNLEHNKKEQERNDELWRELLRAGEKKSIEMIQYACEPFGKELFGKDFPRQPVQFSKSGKNFTFAINELKYIIPAHSGIVIGSPDEFDNSVREFLTASLMFYPVVTVTVPVSSEVRRNPFYDRICDGILRKVPEAYFKGNDICLTVFPTADKIHTIIRNTRESLMMGL